MFKVGQKVRVTAGVFGAAVPVGAIGVITAITNPEMILSNTVDFTGVKSKISNTDLGSNWYMDDSELELAE